MLFFTHVLNRITVVIFISVYGVYVFNHPFNSSNYHTNPFQLLSYFSDIVCLRWYHPKLFNIKPGKPNFLSYWYCTVHDVWKWPGLSCPKGRIRLLAHYIISLLSQCRLTLRHWIYKMFVRLILSSLCLRLSTFCSLIHYTCIWELRFQLKHFPLMIMRMFVLHLIIIIKYRN